jgi:amino acid transporter
MTVEVRSTVNPADLTAPVGQLQRKLDWTDAFWVASGVPAGVLFSIGAIASTIGQPSWVIWATSISIGFLQSFLYAEMAGLFPHKSGGSPVFGAMAWAPYSKLAALLAIWCNWLAWAPVLALGTTLAAGYSLTALFPADAIVNTWSLSLLDLSVIKPGLELRINAIAILGSALLLVTFLMQSFGALHAARMQRIFGIASLMPLLTVAVVPLITGDLPREHFFPLLPLARDAAGQIVTGTWDRAGLSLAAGSLLMAGWSAYSFETAACYTREFKNPRSDTFKAICYSGLLCVFTYTLIPLSFQGVLGLSGMLEPGVADGTGVGAAMARMVGGGAVVANVIVVMLILSLLLVVTTSMMGASRTLYQSSVDGWLPRFLSRVNEHGSPVHAMWVTLAFNLLLLLSSDYIAVLAVACQSYLLFTFFSLQAVWIHRIDRADEERPFRCPNVLLLLGVTFGFINMVFLGAGADVWGPGTLRNGLVAALAVVPLFVYRHYVQDRGRFPEGSIEQQDLQLHGSSYKRAGLWPYVALGVCALLIFVSHNYGAHAQ